MKVIWNGQIIADSDNAIIVEHAYYFPRESVKFEYLKKCLNQGAADWKGVCDLYDVVVDRKTIPEAAAIYETPEPMASHVQGRVVFLEGVDIVE